MGKNYNYITDTSDIVSKPSKDEAEKSNNVSVPAAPLVKEEKSVQESSATNPVALSRKRSRRSSVKTDEVVGKDELARIHCSKRAKMMLDYVKLFSTNLRHESLSLGDVIERAIEEYFAAHFPNEYRMFMPSSKK